MSTGAEFEIDDDASRIDRDVVWEFLSTEAYWGRWRTRDDVERPLDGAWRQVAAYVSGRMGLSAAPVADRFVR